MLFYLTYTEAKCLNESNIQFNELLPIISCKCHQIKKMEHSEVE